MLPIASIEHRRASPSSITTTEDRTRPDGPGGDGDGVGRVRTRRRLHWYVELLIIVVFYVAYSSIRDVHGSHTDAIRQATTNAHRIIRLERDLGIFHEAWVQAQFIHHVTFIRFWDGYYGTAHFVAVAGVLFVLFLKFPDRYRFCRNALAITTALALVGFTFFPLLPPRLLGPPYHFVDTIDTIGGLWSFNNKAVDDVSNLYAAMPSLHTAWSTWCAVSVWPLIRRRWVRPLVILYPLSIVFCIVVTANHYFSDAIGGLITLAIGCLLAVPLTRRMARVRWPWPSWHLRSRRQGPEALAK